MHLNRCLLLLLLLTRATHVVKHGRLIHGRHGGADALLPCRFPRVLQTDQALLLDRRVLFGLRLLLVDRPVKSLF